MQGLAADLDGDGIDEQVVARCTIYQKQLDLGSDSVFDPTSIRLSVSVWDLSLKEKIGSEHWDETNYFELGDANYDNIHTG